MSHTDSTSPINTIIIKIILHTYLYEYLQNDYATTIRVYSPIPIYAIRGIISYLWFYVLGAFSR